MNTVVPVSPGNHSLHVQVLIHRRMVVVHVPVVHTVRIWTLRIWDAVRCLSIVHIGHPGIERGRRISQLSLIHVLGPAV